MGKITTSNGFMTQNRHFLEKWRLLTILWLKTLVIVIFPKNDVFSTMFLPKMTLTTLSTFSTTLLTAVRDVKMTVTRSWNCHFRGHSIMTPSLGKYAFSKKNYMSNGMVWSFSLHLYPYIGYFNEGRNSVRRSFETGIK